MRKTVFMLLFCIAGAFLNISFNKILTISGIGLPLYLDTVLTITVTLFGGLFWGCLTGALTNIIGHSIDFWGWQGYLFALCNIATAFITWLFMRLFPQELKITQRQKTTAYKTMNLVVVLILLSFALCLAMSILGGLISALIQIITNSPADEMKLKALLGESMFSKLPVVLSEIISRIPINIIDRLLSVFLGFGVAFGISRFLKFLLPKKQ